jgi:hypothetical protein
VNNFVKSGLKRYTSPDKAPSKKSPLINKINSKKKGAVAVILATFPDTFTPS